MLNFFTKIFGGVIKKKDGTMFFIQRGVIFLGSKHQKYHQIDRATYLRLLIFSGIELLIFCSFLICLKRYYYPHSFTVLGVLFIALLIFDYLSIFWKTKFIKYKNDQRLL